MAVGEFREWPRVLAQVIRGPPHRKHQRQHLLEVARTLGKRRVRRGKHAVHGVEIRTEPGLQSIPQTGHLAITRLRGKRQRVQVIEQQAFACREILGAVAVHAQRGGDHLHQLVVRVMGDTARRVTELLELSGERARAEGLVWQADRFQALLRDRHAEAFPVDHRVHGGARGIEQFAIFHVEKRAGDQVRHRLEGVVDVPRVARVLQLLAIGIEQAEPGLVLLDKRVVDTALVQFGHAPGRNGLTGDGVAVLLQALAKLGQTRITEPHIPGASVRWQRRCGGAWLHRVADACGEIRGPVRLQGGVAHFLVCDPGTTDE